MSFYLKIYNSGLNFMLELAHLNSDELIDKTRLPGETRYLEIVALGIKVVTEKVIFGRFFALIKTFFTT